MEPELRKESFKASSGRALTGFSLLCLFVDPMDYGLLGSSVHGLSQARILEWVAISFSKRSL